ncbi:uncharacterized protein LOC112568368 isoform X2 [Pomacea canaliculata]|uniref:uncharacterized protein LOC112568368 isoform X2 n=1 Tax=Pomacea canaliculata TaxID=400727 RepID=UPI000D734A5A|nr:uncharacterized protein LOC112568368 isoform X2 [Pomacea canaliculata]
MFESPHVTMSAYVGLIFLVFFSDRYVTSLELCPVWNYLEVKEGRDDNTFTCSGLTDQQEVSWVLTNSVVKTCPPVPPSCTALAYGYFSVSRTSNQNFYITIMATRISDLSILGGNISCQIKTELKTCQLDIIYPAENSQCQVQFNGNTWQITALCSVSKVRSSRNNYRCFLYQVPESSQVSSLGSYTMEVIQASSGYLSGTCNMTSYLPPEGRYSYYVIIFPGNVNVSATFHGNNTISRPISTPNHNCPLYLNEGDTLNCSCFVNDPGNPPGILRWNSTNSSKLEFKNLKKSQNGFQNVCTLTWNNTVYQSVSYTLIVACEKKQRFNIIRVQSRSGNWSWCWSGSCCS